MFAILERLMKDIKVDKDQIDVMLIEWRRYLADDDEVMCESFCHQDTEPEPKKYNSIVGSSMHLGLAKLHRSVMQSKCNDRESGLFSLSKSSYLKLHGLVSCSILGRILLDLLLCSAETDVILVADGCIFPAHRQVLILYLLPFSL
jgi:hypothetical protein